MPAKIPVLSWVGTVKLGICTLGFLAGACCFLTIWYEHPEQVLGKSWWIRVPLVLLALNLFSITITRFRRSWSQFGMISTHVGLITILVGAFLTSVMGINGMVQFAEGETASTYFESQEVLAVMENPDAIPLQCPVPFGAAPSREDVRVRIDLPGGTTVSVDKYYHNYADASELKNDAETPNPLLEVHAWSEHTGEQVERLPEGKTEGHGVISLGGLTTLLFMTPAQDLEAVEKAVARVARIRMGRVHVVAPGRDQPQEIEVQTSLGKDVAIEGTSYTLRLDKFLPSFQVTEDNQETTEDDHPRNPVVLATLTGPKGVEKKRIFVPQMEPPNGATTWPDGMQVRYLVAPYLSLMRLPDGRIFAVGDVLDDPKAPLELSKETGTIRWLGAMLHAVHYSHARLETKPNNANPEENPRALVTVRHGAASKSVWVARSEPDRWTTVELGDARIQVGYHRDTKSFRLPFQLTLDKFIEQTYEGSASPMAWESHLTVKDSEKGETFQYPIKMNEPLFYRGWKFFQSGKDQDPESGIWISTLSVSWDPGQYLIYVGCFFVTVGVLFLFYGKQAVLNWESRRLVARGASPKSTSPEPAPEASVKG